MSFVDLWILLTTTHASVLKLSRSYSHTQTHRHRHRHTHRHTHTDTQTHIYRYIFLCFETSISTTEYLSNWPSGNHWGKVLVIGPVYPPSM